MKQWIWISILSLTATAIHTEDQFRLSRREADIHNTYTNSILLRRFDHQQQRRSDTIQFLTLHPRGQPKKGKSRSVSPKPKETPYERSKSASPDPNTFKFSRPKMANPVSAHASGPPTRLNRLSPITKSGSLNDPHVPQAVAVKPMVMPENVQDGSGEAR